MREGKGFVTFELADESTSERGSRLARADRSSLQRDGFANSPLRGSDSANPSGRASAPHSPANRAHPSLMSSSSQALDMFKSCRTALLEDLGNLVANGLEGKLEDVLACENVVVVANEVGCDGIQYDPFTMGYIEKLGALACELGARADVVVEVVAGVPNVVKGEVPWDC